MNPSIQGYLLDENLSPKLKAGFGADVYVIHARELGDNPSDFTLWTYAQAEALVIVTKDADLSGLCVQPGCPAPLGGATEMWQPPRKAIA